LADGAKLGGKLHGFVSFCGQGERLAVARGLLENTKYSVYSRRWTLILVLVIKPSTGNSVHRFSTGLSTSQAGRQARWAKAWRGFSTGFVKLAVWIRVGLLVSQWLSNT
jgi:hypothetical protein